MNEPSETTEQEPVDVTLEMPGEPEQPSFLSDNPEFAEAFNAAAHGQYQHTLLELWESQLSDELEGYSGEATLDTYSAFLSNWSWLHYDEVETARLHLLKMTQECMDAFDRAIEIVLKGKDLKKSQVYERIEDDWEDNKEFYHEVIAQWTAIVNLWGPLWQRTSIEERPPLHVAIEVATARVLHPRNGLIEQMRNLKGFAFSDEEQQALGERIEFLIGESGE